MLHRLSDSDLIPFPYVGGKGRLASRMARLRPWDFEEYREPFVGSGAVFYQLRRAAACQRYWINDLDPRVATFHRVLRDDADMLVKHLLDIHVEHDGGSRTLFELWRRWRNSPDAMDIAVSVFLRGLITQGSEKRGFGFAQERVAAGKAITRSKIIRLRGFAELLQGVQITSVDYRKVMAAEGTGVFIYADPPYEGVGNDLYDVCKFDLSEFADAIDTSPHSCMWTLNASDSVKAAFARHNVIVHSLPYSAYRSANDNEEIIGTNYTTPLLASYAREFGELLPKAA